MENVDNEIDIKRFTTRKALLKDSYDKYSNAQDEIEYMGNNDSENRMDLENKYCLLLSKKEWLHQNMFGKQIMSQVFPLIIKSQSEQYLAFFLLEIVLKWWSYGNLTRANSHSNNLDIVPVTKYSSVVLRDFAATLRKNVEGLKKLNVEYKDIFEYLIICQKRNWITVRKGHVSKNASWGITQNKIFLHSWKGGV